MSRDLHDNELAPLLHQAPSTASARHRAEVLKVTEAGWYKTLEQHPVPSLTGQFGIKYHVKDILKTSIRVSIALPNRRQQIKLTSIAATAYRPLPQSQTRSCSLPNPSPIAKHRLSAAHARGQQGASLVAVAEALGLGRSSIRSQAVCPSCPSPPPHQGLAFATKRPHPAQTTRATELPAAAPPLHAAAQSPNLHRPITARTATTTTTSAAAQPGRVQVLLRALLRGRSLDVSPLRRCTRSQLSSAS